MMKKSLSMILAAGILVGTMPVAFATTLEELPPSLNDASATGTVLSTTPSTATESSTSTSTGTTTSTSATPTTTRAFDDFKDVSTTNPYYNAIIVLRYQGVLNGYADNTFRPDQEFNRVEALKLIFEVAKISLTNGIAPASFSDTSETEWYAQYLNKAVFMEVVGGYGDGTFRPGKSVNLVEFLKMLELAHKVDLSNVSLNQLAYKDVMPGQWYTKYINYAKINNLVDADANGNVYPDKPITRARAAEIIYRFRNLMQKQETSTSTSTGTATKTDVVAIKDFALYVSVSYKFAIQYPKMWFYSNINSTDATAIRTYGFGPKDLSTNPAVVTLELLPDNKDFYPNLVYNTFNYLKEEGTDGKIKLSTKIDGSTRIYRLTGPAEQEQTMLTMMASLTTNIEGLESTPSAATTTSTTTDTTTTGGTATNTGTGTAAGTGN